MNDLRASHVVLGITGGIAAYKAPDLVRRLAERGFEVRVAMTAAAREFVSPLTFQAVSGHPVRTDLLDPAAEAAMGHIELARWADVVLIAPASADFLARVAHGLADDLLSTICLATDATIAVAPAMNRQMWDAPATRANVAVLESRGVCLVGPGDGSQACGEVGPGRMLEPEAIAAAIDDLRPGTPGEALRGTTVLVTAGPTHEALDPVRYLTNHSSGRMGYAVARAAAAQGARVILVSGPTGLPTPPGVERVDVESATQMHEAIMARIQSCAIFIAAAAVADYAPVRYAESKIKKDGATLSLELARTPDILSDVAGLAHGPFTVGFAAETDDLEANARSKLERKGLDMIAANRVGLPDAGFGVDRNALSVLWHDGGSELPLAPKQVVADGLVTLVAERFRARHSD